MVDVSVQRMTGCIMGVNYPGPIVNHKTAIKIAKDRIYGLWHSPVAREEAGDVRARHGSRKSDIAPFGQRRKATLQQTANKPSPPSLEGDLFA